MQANDIYVALVLSALGFAGLESLTKHRGRSSFTRLAGRLIAVAVAGLSLFATARWFA